MTGQPPDFESLLARRLLLALLPDDDWSRELVAELDHELTGLMDAGRVRRPGWWYARQLASLRTLHFLSLMRRRHHGRDGTTMRPDPSARASWLSGLFADLRHAVRGLTRDPRVALLIVLTLALGIGSVAAMYRVSERLFLSGPPHVRAPEELVRLYLTFEDPAGPRAAPWIPYLTARALQQNATELDGLTLYRRVQQLARVADVVRPLELVEADDRYFSVLGVVPEVGRFFGSDAGDADGAPAVLSHALAVTAFGSAADALGRPIELAGRRHTVVAVAPEGFAGPHVERVDVWVPFDAARAGNRNWWAVGRLQAGARPGAVERATAEAEAIHGRTEPGRFYGWAREGKVRLADVSADDAGKASAESSIARLLLAMVSLLLLIACANVVNLLLARMTRRRGEIVVRLALGISRARLARLLVGESLLLGLAGGLLSVPVAQGAGVLLRNWLLPQIAWTGSPMDARTALLATLAACALGVLLGVLPARQAGRTALVGGLASERVTRSAARSRTQSLLATAQVALSAALLMSAGLFLKSFWTIRVTDLGVANDALVVSLRSLDDDAIPSGSDPEREVYDRALATVREVPGGERAALTVGLPFMYNFGLSIWVDGLDSVPELPGGGPYFSAVSGGYFDAVGTPLLRGLPITDEQAAGGERVMVVSESMAETLWPATEALGACVRLAAEGECWRVIGVVGDVHRQGYREPPSMQFYVPLGHEKSSFGGMALVVRPARNAAAVAEQVTAALRGLDPRVDYAEVARLDALLDAEVRPWRLGATVLSLAALLAVFVSLLGVYGVLSYILAQRRAEIGVRLALGASGGSIRGLIARAALAAAAFGTLAGVALMLSVGRWLGPLLFETSVWDPMVIAGVGVLLAGGALLACAAPALQAGRVNPLDSLRGS